MGITETTDAVLADRARTAANELAKALNACGEAGLQIAVEAKAYEHMQKHLNDRRATGWRVHLTLSREVFV